MRHGNCIKSKNRLPNWTGQSWVFMLKVLGIYLLRQFAMCVPSLGTRLAASQLKPSTVWQIVLGVAPLLWGMHDRRWLHHIALCEWEYAHSSQILRKCMILVLYFGLECYRSNRNCERESVRGFHNQANRVSQKQN